MHLTATFGAGIALVLGVLPAQAQSGADKERIAQLLAELADPVRRPAAERELRTIGRAAAQLLADSLRERAETAATVPTLRVLAAMGPDAGPVAVEIVGVEADLSPPAFLEYLQTLGTLAPYSELGIADALGGTDSILSRVLLAAEPATRLQIMDAASRAEARFALKADAPLPELALALREHADSRVRELAIELLGHRGAAAKPFLGDLSTALESSHPKVLRADSAGWSAAGRPTAACSRAPHDDAVHAAAATAMVRIAPADPLVVPAHAYRLQHAADEVTRAESARALGSLGGAAAGAVPSLVAALGDASLPVVREAITTLGMLGPAAAEAIPALQELARQGDDQTRECAKAALRQIKAE